MELALGAMSRLIPKLFELLKDEYVLQKGLKREIESLRRELETTHAALSCLPPLDQLDELHKLKTRQLRELCYDLEDAIDVFNVRIVMGSEPATASNPNISKNIASKFIDSLKKVKYRRQISKKIRDIKNLSEELAKRYARFQGTGGNDTTTSTRIDPRVLNLYKNEADLVGIEAARDDLIRRLTETENHASSSQKQKIIIVTGMAGLGKTTLAKVVYDRLKTRPGDATTKVAYSGGTDGARAVLTTSCILDPSLSPSTFVEEGSIVERNKEKREEKKGEEEASTSLHPPLSTIPKKFDYGAFVSIGRNPNISKKLKEMLKELNEKYKKEDMSKLDVEDLWEELHGFLRDKRYLIVIDDIWDVDSWEAINHALEDNNCGSRIIVTTRNKDVVTKGGDNVCNLKPLSENDSKELFYKRIFGGQRKSLDSHLAEVSEKICYKCDGVPLAIIAMASLLAERPWKDWLEVYNSIILGEEDKDKTRNIFLYSYYDLPSHLKQCLLYLSILLEDCTYEKHPLIWMWIAEGFIELKGNRGNLFEVGESYFNALINRSMIIPVVESKLDRYISKCRVHDIVLDLIQELSTKENFVTRLIADGKQCPSVGSFGMPHIERKARRLTLQNCHLEHIPQDTMCTTEAVRSLHILCSEVKNMPPLSSFQICRVLSLEHSNIPSIKHLGKLQHLSYLMINTILCDELLINQIGDLKSLKILILRDNTWLDELPPAVCALTQLMCLRVIGIKRVPAEGIGNLVLLEELVLDSIVGLDHAQTEVLLVQLGKLTSLRVLKIKFEEALEGCSLEALEQSLCNLLKIEDLELSCDKDLGVPIGFWEGWKPPRQIRRLSLEFIKFSRMPSWIKHSDLPRLSYLDLSVDFVEVRDLDELAKLSGLLYIRLQAYTIPHGYIVGADRFKNLRVCRVDTTFKFLQGAASRLEALSIQVVVGYDVCYHVNGSIHLRVMRTRDAIDDLDFGLGNLASLEEVVVEVACYEAFLAEVEEAEAMVRHAVHNHPNRPTLEIKRLHPDYILPDKPVQRKEAVVRVVPGTIFDGPNLACVTRITSTLRWAPELYLSLDCEGAKLCEVEELEAAVRHAAHVHGKQHSLKLIRINSDKMVSSGDLQEETADHDDSAGNSIQQQPSVSEEQYRQLLDLIEAIGYQFQTADHDDSSGSSM